MRAIGGKPYHSFSSGPTIEGVRVCSECGADRFHPIHNRLKETAVAEDSPDPISPLGVAAVAVREMFLSYLSAGFTEDQAIRIIAYMMAEQTRDNGKEPNA